MLKSARTRAEQQFAAIQKKDGPAPQEEDKETQERANHVANLRALRLAKETTDKKAAKSKKPSRSAQARRA